jgi:hypothetical protein
MSTGRWLIPRVGAESVPLVLIGEAAMRVKDGRPREALSCIERAADLAIASSPLDVPRARLLESQAHGELGETAPALAAGEAVRPAGQSGQRLVRARALTALADLYEATGEPAGLVRAQALALYDDMAIRPAVGSIPAR